MRDAEKDLKKVRNENRFLKKLMENLDNVLGRYRTQSFLEEEFEEVRRFDRDLIELLMKGGLYTQQILSNLNIDASDSDLKAVNKQFSRGGLRLA